MSGISINVRDGATPKLRALMDHIGSTLRTRLHRNMGRAIQNLCRKHLIGLAGSRHDSAQKIGGTPTGFLGYAAEACAQPAALSADAEAATLTIVHPSMARIEHDVTIRAGTQTPGIHLLTIPIAPEAYGYRIYQGADPRFPGGFWFTSKKGNAIYGVRDGKDIHPLYVGKEEVTLKQDRSLLPSDAEIMKVANDSFEEDLRETVAGLSGEIERRVA
jgi:hypothetical protein